MNKNFLRVIFLVILLMAVSGLSAKVDIGDYFDKGSFFMYIISFLLIVMIILAVIKFWQLSIKEKIDAKQFYLKLKGYIKNGQIDKAIRISSQFKKTTMGFMFWNGLVGYNDGLKLGKRGVELKQHLQNSFDEAGLQKIPSVEANLFWFDIIAQASTLLGLLGTIYGLITAFDALATAPEAEKTARLTAGIATAMGTTFYGLVVAIPTQFINGALRSRAETIANDIDQYSVKMVNQITYSLKD